MVSTRGIRYKFSEGERVLCYEPDPTKAKVLYDSKVLEVIESKDKRGRRTVEYLIHFQGWNSSWDRSVGEDFVLKDTQENRQLQKDLAQKSQLQLGAYLYRRERKKPAAGGSTGAGPAKRARHGFSDDGSSSSTQAEVEIETGDTDSSSASNPSEARPQSPQPALPAARAEIILPLGLKQRMTLDYHLVVKRGCLSRLPATPCVAQILESFVKWYARAGAWQPRPRTDPPQRPDLRDVSCRLNLVREVADGLRVYFDFILRSQLLYRQEIQQYHDICGQFLDGERTFSRDDAFVKSEPDEYGSEDEEDCGASDVEKDEDEPEDGEENPATPEYSHLPPDPIDADNKIKIEVKEEPQDEDNINEAEDEEMQDDEMMEEEVTVKQEPVTEDDDEIYPRLPPALRKHPAFAGWGLMARKLRSYKLQNPTAFDFDNPSPSTSTRSHAAAVAMTKHGAAASRSYHRSVSPTYSRAPTPAPAPATAPASATAPAQEPARAASVASAASIAEPKFEKPSSSVGSSVSSHSSGWAAAAAPPPARSPLAQLLDRVAKWQIIPREGTDHLPCRVYGAMHLARLFVRLPSYLDATQMPDFKLKLILKHMDMFVKYLYVHPEWFREEYYPAEVTSRSH